MAGFLALPRDVFDLWFPHPGDGLKASLFVYLCAKANWQDSIAPLPKQKICLQAGQLVVSRRDLAAYFSVSEGRIRTALDSLAGGVSSGSNEILPKFLRYECSPLGTIVTILDYKSLFLDVRRDQPTDSPLIAHQKPYHDKETREQGNKEQEDTFVGSARADPTPYGSFLELWNQNRGQLASVQKITKGRKLKIKARLTEEPNLDYWAQTVKRMAASTFCCSGGWASFDWLTTNDTNHLKVNEGKYDDKGSNKLSLVEQFREYMDKEEAK